MSPLAPVHQCPGAGCTALTLERGLCLSCRQRQGYTQREARGSYERFYHTAAWLKLRAYVLVRAPLCALDCAEHGHVTPATDVDHIKAISTPEGWALRLDNRNCRPACHSCHSKRTFHEQGMGRRRRAQAGGIGAEISGTAAAGSKHLHSLAFPRNGSPEMEGKTPDGR